MRKSQAAVPVTLLLLLNSGCGASVRVTPFSPGKYPPRPAEHAIQMFSTKAPECPYEELGLIHAEPETGLTKWQRVVDGFLARARQLGGDAIILRHASQLRASEENVVVDNEVLIGTVVRFETAACQR